VLDLRLPVADVEYPVSSLDGNVSVTGRRVVLQADVLFAFNSARLGRRARSRIAAAVRELRDRKPRSVRVVGYTDSRALTPSTSGSRAAAPPLSSARCAPRSAPARPRCGPRDAARPIPWRATRRTARTPLVAAHATGASSSSTAEGGRSPARCVVHLRASSVRLPAASRLVRQHRPRQHRPMLQARSAVLLLVAAALLTGCGGDGSARQPSTPTATGEVAGDATGTLPDPPSLASRRGRVDGVPVRLDLSEVRPTARP